MHRIYIGYEPQQDIAYKVLVHSLLKHSSAALEIIKLDKELVSSVLTRERDQLQSTEFTFYRFAIPELQNHEGICLYMDCDMLVFDDISSVFESELKTLRVVKHQSQVLSKTKMLGKIQTSYPRKNWSSFMLMNTENLRVWNRETINSWDGISLHSFVGIPDSEIESLESNWNSLDYYCSSTKNLHFTEGGPWLGIDHPYSDVWKEYLQNVKNWR